MALYCPNETKELTYLLSLLLTYSSLEVHLTYLVA